MSDTRAAMLGAIRRQLRRGPLDGEAAAALEARLRRHPAGLAPARGQVHDGEAVELFKRFAAAYQATLAEVAAPTDVPAAVQEYLKAQNLPARVVMAPDPALEACGWQAAPLLEIRRGRAEDADKVSVTGAFAGVAETGTLVFTSGPEHPTTLNLLPDTQIVVLRRDQVVGNYEEMWRRLRARYGEDAMPRTVNTVTGPSRTGDIEQTLELGAHGPRRLHIVLVGEPG